MDREITDYKEQENHITVILPDKSFLKDDVRELWQYRELIRMFVRRDFKTMYAQTVLGPAWFILTTLFSSSVMTLVFGQIADIQTDGAPQFLFYMAGNILWSNFSGCLTGAAGTFTANARLMGKVYFPRLCVPISTVLSKQIRFGIQAALFFLLYLWSMWRGSGIRPGWAALLTPLLIVELMTLAMGCGIIVASLTTKYRDLAVLLTFGLQIWMYITPVVYPLSQIPKKWRAIMMLNPMAPVVETFRRIWFGTGDVPAGYLAVSICVTLVILGIGLALFQRAQRSFMDTI